MGEDEKKMSLRNVDTEGAKMMEGFNCLEGGVEYITYGQVWYLVNQYKHWSRLVSNQVRNFRLRNDYFVVVSQLV